MLCVVVVVVVVVGFRRIHSILKTPLFTVFYACKGIFEWPAKQFMNVRKFTGICIVFTPSTSKNAPPSHASSHFAKHVYHKNEKCATQWTASVHTLHIPKPVITFVFKVLRNGLLRYMLYTCQTCDYVRVPNATQWTASVHTLHMPKPVIAFVFKVLRNGLLWLLLDTCSNL